jgi:hypothetical protein
MTKTVPVSVLKQGDRFEFVTDRSDKSKGAVLVVTRDPAVNKIANSCHFRYQADSSATGPDKKWDDNQSWNGTPDVRVLMVEARPSEEPTLSSPPQHTPIAGKTVDKKSRSAPKKKRTE